MSKGTKVSTVLAVTVLAASLLVLVVAAKPAVAATLPPGFEDQKVASVGKPIALAFTPDDRMLVATQPGQLRVFKNGQLLQTPALNLSSKSCSNAERGLLGVAVDPNFSTNHYVYLYYTYNKYGACPTTEPTSPSNPVNRVSRFVMSGDTADPASEKVLIDNIPSPNGQHSAGDLRFGKENYLYVSVGDGGCDYAGDSGCAGVNDASRDTNVLLGKVLRITRDGLIPTGNPYTGTGSARCNLTGRTDPGKNCQETFASGLRNPFRFAFDPDSSDTRFFVNDVGQNAWDEVDQGKAGADYGWNLCEGNHDNPDRGGSVNCAAAPYTPPTHEYGHADTGCSSITGGAFVPNGAWPASYDNSYLFGDYVCNKIFELKPASGGGYTMSEFASGLLAGGPIAMAFGPNGSGKALYYTTYGNSGEIHRITYTSTANQQPTAAVTATPTSGDVPLEVSLDGSTSSDPDSGDTLTYAWDFGDGSATVETATPTTSHTYTTAGTYTATLTVRDKSGAEDSATVEIDIGNASPKPSIEAPTASKLFRVGEQIALQGSATDPQDGQLPNSALEWELLRHHNCDHTHPFFSQTGNNLTFTAPPPEDLAATDPNCNYLEIKLSATDSDGNTKTVTQNLKPRTVNMTFKSQPSGLSLQVNGETFAAPRTFLSWENYKLTISAPDPQTLSGTKYGFVSWSDGKELTHDVLTRAGPSTYTAAYAACTIVGTSGNDVLDGTSGNDIICGLGGDDTIRGLDGNDTLYGGGGTDTLYGGNGTDTLYGGAGNDTLKGEASSDKFYGEAGNDTIDGGSGSNDFAYYSNAPAAVNASLATNTATGEGSDTFVSIEGLQGSRYNDTLTGNSAINRLYGSGGTDKLYGNDGSDTLSGGAGTDTLYGGAGNDTIKGESGADGHYGGDGDDTLTSKDNVNGNDTVDGGAGTDACTTDATEKSIVSCP